MFSLEIVVYYYLARFRKRTTLELKYHYETSYIPVIYEYIIIIILIYCNNSCYTSLMKIRSPHQHTRLIDQWCTLRTIARAHIDLKI